MTDALRVVFMGTPEFAVPSLQRLHERADVRVTLVVSQPDRPAGRGRKVTPTPVAAFARASNLPLAQPESLRTPESVAAVAAAEPDIIVVVAYGQILRAPLLDLPPAGCLNVHASLLPRWRGAAPIQWAVASGDAVTGVSLMRMDRGLDTGPVHAMVATPIGALETAGELHDRLSTLGAELLDRHVHAIAAGTLAALPQVDDRACHARTLRPADRCVPFERSAREVMWHIHGMTPWPGACAVLGDETIRLLRARVASTDSGHAATAPGTVVAANPEEGLRIVCGDGNLVEVLEITRPGRRPNLARECLRGFNLSSGIRARAPK